MKIIAAIFLVLYLYVLAFGIFMTDLFRIPAPLIFCVPLVFFFKEKDNTEFIYWKILLLLASAGFLYYVVGLSVLNGFAANIICIIVCALFFNHFVGISKERFNYVVAVFFGLLTVSCIVLVFDHFYEISKWRAMLMGERVMQSPSGIAIYQFNFGYQVAALTPFAFIYTCVFNKSLLVKGLVLAVCLGFLFLCMQRSAFVAFIFCVVLFMLLYYRGRAVISLTLMVLVCAGVYNYVLKDNLDNVENIITKNVHNDAAYNRGGLVEENLRIYIDYPFGLIFYGKNWGDVIYRDYVFSSGITSHNAYLMFFTYLGPFLGLGLLVGIYYKVSAICIHVMEFIRMKENAMLVCLCFSFIGVSINALSHNPWLIGADGPTIFLYFGILHLYWQQKYQAADLMVPEQSHAYA
ncbi:O-antigen ligase family protein [Pedobacter frigoris]|uniref:O-antigen ligase family protein n=1 Tax=Pedobacter frigoris TaxID=2571272 RepID=UPI00292F19EF|nr:O-antigen ligase family protein [Pedobacter frigoris]